MTTPRQQLVDRVIIRLCAQRANRRLYPDGRPFTACGEKFREIFPETPEPKITAMNEAIEGMAQEQGLMDFYLEQNDRQYYRMTREIHRKVMRG